MAVECTHVLREGGRVVNYNPNPEAHGGQKQAATALSDSTHIPQSVEQTTWTSQMPAPPHFVTLGMFILDEFTFMDETGQPTGKFLSPQIGGGGTYAVIGARIWLPVHDVGMIVDRGHDFPQEVQDKLDSYGSGMWLYRDHPDMKTTRALNSYRGEHRGFEYTTPRIHITPSDLTNTRLTRPSSLHFICSPSRAASILRDVEGVEGWYPITIYEPIPVRTEFITWSNPDTLKKDRCVPEELPTLLEVLPKITILSPNAEEALSLLSVNVNQPPTKQLIEEAANTFLKLGAAQAANRSPWVIIRSGIMGAYVMSPEGVGKWCEAFWTNSESHVSKVMDVTGAGNAFLGGLAAGLLLTKGDIFQSTLYAAISSSFVIEQEGLPSLSRRHDEDDIVEQWNSDLPKRRLEEMQKRFG